MSFVSTQHHCHVISDALSCSMVLLCYLNALRCHSSANRSKFFRNLKTEPSVATAMPSCFRRASASQWLDIV